MTKSRPAVEKSGAIRYTPQWTSILARGNTPHPARFLRPLDVDPVVLELRGSSLHAKTFAVDSSRLFVGSFNFDPRSAQLNTQLGFVIESPTMAQEIERAFATGVPNNA